MVLEDGVAQKVDTFQEAVAPVSVVLALDASGSMTRAADGVRAAALSFVEALRPEDALSVLLFSDCVGVRARPDDRSAAEHCGRQRLQRPRRDRALRRADRRADAR